MKKTVRIFVIIAMLFTVSLMTACNFDQYQDIDEKYTVRFVDEDGKIVKSITKLVSERISEKDIPAFPEQTGKIGGWSLDGNQDINYSLIKTNTIIKAEYSFIKYNVVFQDYDGTILKEEVVEYSSDATAPQDPTREGYTFTGWDKDFTSISSDLYVKAQYNINKYEVVFKDHDGTVLSTQEVEYLADAVAPQDPTREGYTFKAWDKAFEDIKGDLEVTAQYTINKYQVVFKDHDGTVLSTQEVEYLADAVAPQDPTREGYTFKAWDKAFEDIKGDLEVTAQYNINKYEVVFKDHDGTVLSTQEVEYLADAVAPQDPTRKGYTFKAWDKTFEDIKANLEVTAQYTINKYQVVFKDHDGTVLSTQEVEYLSAAVAPANPTRTGYTFKAWDKAFDAVENDLEVVAVYVIDIFQVVFKDYDGTVIETQQVDYLTDAVAPQDPTRTGYTFTGWDKGFTAVTSDLEVTAQYTINKYSITVQLPVVLETGEEGFVLQVLLIAEYDTHHDLTEKLTRIVASAPGFTFNGWKLGNAELTSAEIVDFVIPAEDVILTPNATINTYNVTFLDVEGNTIAVVPTLYKHAAAAPAAPAVEGYTFTGWDKDITSITKDITVQAQYTINVYTVTFLDENNAVLETQQVTYKEAATAPAYSKIGYTYVWDKDFSSITGDLEVKVVLTPKTYIVKIYVGDNTFTYVENPDGTPLYYGDTFTPQFTVEGEVEFTGKLIVVPEECSEPLSAEFYMNSYVIEDVAYVVFRAELTPKQ